MATQLELLRGALVLIKTVRKWVSVSENMLKLIEKHANTNFYQVRIKNIISLRDEFIRNGQKYFFQNGQKVFIQKYIESVILKKVGYCDELVDLILFLSQYIVFDSRQEIYISTLACKKHSFCILHQDRKFHMLCQGEIKEIAGSFFNLSTCLKMDFILMDPWLYKVTLGHLLNTEHTSYMDAFNVKGFYEGPVFSDQASYVLGAKKYEPAPPFLQPLIYYFNSRYNYFKTYRNITRKSGTGFYAVERRVGLMITPPTQWECLLGLEKFLTKIISHQQKFDTRLNLHLNPNLPKMCFDQAARYLKNCISGIRTRQYRISSQKLRAIMYSFLKIALLIQEDLSPESMILKTTHMGWALLYSTTMFDKYAFEVLEGMNLNILRRFSKINGHAYNEKDRYYFLCEYIHLQNIQYFLAQHAPMQFVDSLGRPITLNTQSGRQVITYIMAFCLSFAEYHKYCYAQFNHALSMPEGGLNDEPRVDEKWKWTHGKQKNEYLIR